MSKHKNFLHFDQIEQKLVFRISRTFFWIFVTIAGISILAAFIVLIYSIIPPSQSDVVRDPYPSEPTVSLEVSFDEIQTALIPVPSQPIYVESTPQVTKPKEDSFPKYEKPIDSLQLKINLLKDSLGTFIKSSWGITYESQISGYDWFGRPIYTQKAKRGLKSDLEYVLNEYFEPKQEKIKKLEFLINVMQQISAENREKALRFFIKSINDKWKLYQRTMGEYNKAINSIESDYSYRLASAEAEYARAKFEKAELSNKSLISIGSAVVLIALL
jgi:hypothetical protein